MTESLTQEIFNVAMNRVAEEGWDNLQLDALGFSPQVVEAHFPTKKALVSHLRHLLMPEALAPEDCVGASAKERVLEILMQRFERMVPYKDAIKRLYENVRCHPDQWAFHGKHLLVDMRHLMQKAHVGRDGPLGVLQGVTLGGLYVRTLLQWLQDPLPSLESVMARLDQGLTWCDQQMERYL